MPSNEPKSPVLKRSNEDLLIVPAQEEGFNQVFIDQNCWYAIRIARGKLDQIKYIAAYQTSPVRAVTHVAQVHSIEPYGDTGKFKVNFVGPAKDIKHIPFADAKPGSMQGVRYSSYEKLTKADKLPDLF